MFPPVITEFVTGWICRRCVQTTATVFMACSVATGGMGAESKTIEVSERAHEIHRRALVVDGHNDLPWTVRRQGSSSFERLDISQPQPEIHTDIPRLRAGGVGGQFWSVYVPASTSRQGTSLQTTLEQIEIVKQMIARYPETFALALTAADVERIHQQGKIASLIGMEGGHSIENSLNVLRQLYELGARYMTLTHSDTLDWADSATDSHRHGGLTEFGEQVVREMNRLGMLVDLSHVSVETMQDALRVSTAPIIFSHSSARAIADHPRNVPDQVLRGTAKNGGVVMVNYYPTYVQPEAARRGVERMKVKQALAEQYEDEAVARAELRKWEVKHPTPAADIHDVLDHIEHIIQVAGIDHVGLGSDYDGVDALPQQLEDVSTYPRITQGLLDRGYDESQIRKVLGENIVRVMREAERAAQRMQQKGNESCASP